MTPIKMTPIKITMVTAIRFLFIKSFVAVTTKVIAPIRSRTK